jgi:hypothetical protein
MAMNKLAAVLVGIGTALIVAQSAHARGNTVRRSEPYVVHPDPHKIHGWAPIRVYSPLHHHYHLTYHP